LQRSRGWLRVRRLRVCEQRARSRDEATAAAHPVGRAPGVERFRLRSAGKPLRQPADPAADEPTLGCDAPKRCGHAPRGRVQKPGHLAAVLVRGRLQMGNPDEQSLVLLPQRLEEVVQIPHHLGHSIRIDRSLNRYGPHSAPPRVGETARRAANVGPVRRVAAIAVGLVALVEPTPAGNREPQRRLQGHGYSSSA
jgi:hypothetical protein